MALMEHPTETVFTIAMTPLKFGPGVTNEVGYDLKRLGVKKALIITDENLSEMGLADRVKGIIEGEGVKADIFDGVHIEPTDKSMAEAVKFAEGRGYDGFVGLGGGSVMDTAKAIDLFTTYPAPLMDYVNKPIGKALPVPGPLKPLIAIPTTAGTGSESTPVIVLDFLDLKLKSGISHPYIRPTLAVVDPLNTLSLPPEVTAASGMDVLTHALESYTNKPYNTRPRPATPGERPSYVGANPVSDVWCEKAIELGGKYLRRAVMNGYDLEARANMMLACTCATVGFSNAGVHIPHSMGYPIAGMVKDYIPPGYKIDYPLIPHGIAVTVGAPAAFRFTAPARPESHAKAAGLLGARTEGLSTLEAAASLSEALISLMRDINFPSGVGALGYVEEDIPALAEGTLKQQRLLVGSPRTVGKRELEQIFKDAMAYW
ncbi:MAG: hydroxyacid-oxoacid transhydrogenase [Candidatus Geothermarchaeales archaeon]